MRRLVLLLVLLAPFLIAARTDNMGGPTTGAIGGSGCADDCTFTGVTTTEDLAVDGAFLTGSATEFAEDDTTPSVLGGINFITHQDHGAGDIITNFDDGVDGQFIKVSSGSIADVTFDCDSVALTCGSTDIVISTGHYATWRFNGLAWQIEDVVDYTLNNNPGGVVTYEQLDINGDIGFGAAQVPQGSAVSGLVTYEQLDANSDIGFGSAQVPRGILTASLTSPALVGNPTSTTPPAADNDTSIATTAFFQSEASGNFCSLTGCTLTGGLVIAHADGLDIQDGAGNSALLTYDANAFNIDLHDAQSIYIGRQVGGDTLSNSIVAIGDRAGQDLTGTSTEDLLIGAGAGQHMTVGARNICIGTAACANNAGGSSNTVMGKGAGSAALASFSSTALFGQNSGASLTDGVGNLFFGTTSGQNVTGGDWNIIFSSNTYCTTCDYNVLIAKEAFSRLVSNDYNIGIGFRSGRYQTGSFSTAVGVVSLAGSSGASAGNNNTGLGAYSGFLTQGSGGLYLGYYAGGRQTASNMLVIDNQDRGSIANELTDAMIIGTFNAAPASQTLAFNAVTSVSQMFDAYKLVNTSTGGALTINGVTIATAVADYDLPDECDSPTGAWATLQVRDAEVASLTVTDTADTINYVGIATMIADDELDSSGAALESITVVCMETNEWYTTASLGTWADGGVAD